MIIVLLIKRIVDVKDGSTLLSGQPDRSNDMSHSEHITDK